MAAHRLYRLYIFNSNSGSYCGVAELELRTVADTPETPSGGTAIGSSRYSSSYDYSYAFDGNNSTYWRQYYAEDPENQWVGYDYGSGNDKEIVQYAITAPSSATYAPKQFQLEVSDDNGATWQIFSIPPADQTAWSAGEQRVFDVDPPMPQAVRSTQIPILVVEKSSQPARIGQFPILLVALPAQPAMITQLPILVSELDVETPLPTPFLAIPDDAVDEELAWLTSVVISDNGSEQRSALRDSPRRRFSFDAIFLTEEERRQYIDILKQHQELYVDWPLWAYSAHLTPVATGATELTFDPKATDLRDDEYAAVYNMHNGETHIVQVDAVTATGCTLAAATDFNIDAACFICPLLKMRTRTVGKLATDSVSGAVSMNLEYVDDREFVRDSTLTPLTKYGNEIIVDKFQLAGIEDTYDKGVTWVDNDTAVPLPFAHFKSVFKAGTRAFKLGRYNGDLDWLRAFLVAVKGQRGTFRIPTYFDDLPLAEQPALSATKLVSTNVQFEKYLYSPVNKVIRIESDAGVIYRRIGDFRRVFDSQGNPVALQVTLDASIGATAGSNVIKRISVCPLARLDNDVVKLTHGYLDVTVSMDIRTVDA